MRSLLLSLVLLLSACGTGDDARHEVSIPWSLEGQWLVADLHTHTRFSDGGLTVEELAGRAVMNGCGALAITDHSDHSVKSVEPEFFEQVDAFRRSWPEMILLTGLEWNVPPYGGREHVNLIVDPRIERAVLPPFKAQFDRETAG